MRDFVPEYHHAKFGCNWTTNKGETEGGTMCSPPTYMVPKDPSLNRVNSPSKSLKGVLLIFAKERSATTFNRDTEEFYNPKITVVESPNELYAQNMEYRHQYDEIMKHFGEGRLKDAGTIRKDLQLHNVNITSYYTDQYALWLDLRTKDYNKLHGSGRRLENASEEIRLQITKEAEKDACR